MDASADAFVGNLINRLLRREDLHEEEAYQGFAMVLRDQPAELHQGAFLAALTAKGETAAEVAGGWRAVYELDTVQVSLDHLPLVDTCGTGMDSCKTFNISTAASLLAASGGVTIARHGARAITSRCGTVDIAERLGVDVDCPVELVATSIEKAGIGLFNGMSPAVHPRLLGRILSSIRFGSPLNIIASLANPARPRLAVRGVHSPALLHPAVVAMQAIGYQKALVICGTVTGSQLTMDEASVCGPTLAVLLENGVVTEFSFSPKEAGLGCYQPELLAPEADIATAARRLLRVLANKDLPAPTEAVLLNAGAILWLAGRATDIASGVRLARQLLERRAAIDSLYGWVAAQNRAPDKGQRQLEQLLQEAGL